MHDSGVSCAQDGSQREGGVHVAELRGSIVWYEKWEREGGLGIW